MEQPHTKQCRFVDPFTVLLSSNMLTLGQEYGGEEPGFCLLTPNQLHLIKRSVSRTPTWGKQMVELGDSEPQAWTSRGVGGFRVFGLSVLGSPIGTTRRLASTSRTRSEFWTLRTCRRKETAKSQECRSWTARGIWVSLSECFGVFKMARHLSGETKMLGGHKYQRVAY